HRPRRHPCGDGLACRLQRREVWPRTDRHVVVEVVATVVADAAAGGVVVGAPVPVGASDAAGGVGVYLSALNGAHGSIPPPAAQWVKPYANGAARTSIATIALMPRRSSARRCCRWRPSADGLPVASCRAGAR